jgi:hypothetical protein
MYQDMVGPARRPGESYEKEHLLGYLLNVQPLLAEIGVAWYVLRTVSRKIYVNAFFFIRRFPLQTLSLSCFV